MPNYTKKADTLGVLLRPERHVLNAYIIGTRARSAL